MRLTLAAAVVLGAGALYATSSSEPTLYVSVNSSDPAYVDVQCHWTGMEYVTLPPIDPTPALPSYQAMRGVQDTHPCGP